MVTMNRPYFVFSDLSSLDFNAIVDGSDTFKAAERVYDEQEIEGRNGSLLFDKKRYTNVEVGYQMTFEKIVDLEAFRSALMSKLGYYRLEDTYHDDEYRMAYVTGAFEPETDGYMHEWGAVMVTFSCKPQRFLKEGEREYTFSESGQIFNPTHFESEPRVRVYGAGTFKMGDVEIEVLEHASDYVEIDSEIMDCYFGDINLNGFVKLPGGDFPKIKSGWQPITIGEGITKVVVTPRWWRL